MTTYKIKAPDYDLDNSIELLKDYLNDELPERFEQLLAEFSDEDYSVNEDIEQHSDGYNDLLSPIENLLNSVPKDPYHAEVNEIIDRYNGTVCDAVQRFVMELHAVIKKHYPEIDK